MAADRSDTTPREESYLEASSAGLALEWVWPTRQFHPLGMSRISIGRDERADMRLERSGVSRQHAELYRQGPLYVLNDLGSTNGTWLDGRRVERAPVAAGSVVRIGECVGLFVQRAQSDPAFAEVAPGVFGGAEMARLLTPARSAAPSEVPVVLIGETGSGKERVARAIHAWSGRQGAFFGVNCAALTETLAESELFGHRRGAFTGAEKANPGYFRAADGGTLFLDELPDLSLSLQAKLLRVIEDGQVLPLGETVATRVDVRIVVASQRRLAELVAERLFRRDLAARLNGLELRLPSLAARRADVAPLFTRFLRQHTGANPPTVDARVVESLCLHDWPENVRELELVTRTLVAVHGSAPVLRRQHLPAELAARCEGSADVGASGGEAAKVPAAPPTLGLAQLQQELRSNGGNVRATAKKLGVSRQRIYRMLEGSSGRVDAAASNEEADGAVDQRL